MKVHSNNGPAFVGRQAGGFEQKGKASSDGKNAEVRKLLTQLKSDGNKQSGDRFSIKPESSNAFGYSDALRAQREKTKDTSLKLKKLKYQFKDISSKIIRSKTSSTARQVASQVRRELLRLKREKQSGNYDSEEIDAAISHAKAMERVARKKVRHLEEEEMAKASGGPCAGDMIDDEETLAEENEHVSEDIESDENLSDEMDEILSDEMGDLLKDMSSDMKELLEEMGMEELSDSVSGGTVHDMDPEDLKAMIVKHRNKEMKEIVKADSEYLKAMFEHFERLKAGTDIVGGFGSLGSIGALDGFASGAAPVIDVSL